MKIQLACFLVFIAFSAFKCRLSKEPTSLQYWSIAESKKNGAFVSEYHSQLPFIRLDGRTYYIKEAWVEHPYYQNSFGDQIDTNVTSFIMTFQIQKGDNTDLDTYIEGIGNGNMRIWFFLPSYGNHDDTIAIRYRDSSDLPTRNKTFLVFKK